jgi:hypothetical protein
VLAALQRCADALTDPVARAVTCAGLARTLLLAGQTAAAERRAGLAWAELPAVDAVAAVAVSAAPAAPALQATILTNLGAPQRAHAPADSIAPQRRAVALWAAAGDAHGLSVGRCNLALAAQRAGAPEALVLTGQAMRDSRAQGDKLQHALACNLAGEAWSRLGRWPEAAQACRDCIAAALAAAEPWPLVYGLWNLAQPWAHCRRPEAAARLMGFAEQHTPGVTGPLSRADRHDLRRLRRLCERQADAGDVTRWWHEGAALNLSAAVQRALRAG